MRCKPLITAAAVLALTLGNEAVLGAALETAAVQLEGGGQVYVADGYVEAIRQSVIAAQVPGRVTALTVKAGDSIKSGQVLAKIDERAAAQQAAASQAQVAAAQAQVEVARKEYERNTTGAQFSAPGFGASNDATFRTKIDGGPAISWAIVAQLPLYNAERRASSRQIERHATLADVQFRNAEQELMLRAVQAYFAVILAEETLSTLRAQGEAAARALEVAKGRFEEGATPVTDRDEAQARFDEVGARTMLDLMNAQSDFYQAQRNLTAAKYQLLLDRLRLAASAGVLSDADLREANAVLTAGQ